MPRRPTVPPHLRDDRLLLKAVERYTFFLQTGARLALYLTDKSILSCDAHDADKMAEYERRWKLVGIYDRNASPLQILFDVREAGAAK